MNIALRAPIALLQIWRSINAMKRLSGVIGTDSLIGTPSLFASALADQFSDRETRTGQIDVISA